MKKQAEFIKRIVIKGLWGRKDIAWDLRKDVNILSGVNGIGKSSILNSSVDIHIQSGGCRFYTFRRYPQFRPSAYRLRTAEKDR